MRRIKLLELKAELKEAIRKLQALRTTAGDLSAAEMDVILRLVNILLME